MKTNNLSKKSFLTSMVLMLSSVFSKSKTTYAPAAPNGYLGGGSPIYIPQRKKMKGYQVEARRCSFGKNR